QVWRTQMEEAQRVRLHKLCQVHDPAQLLRCFRDPHCQQRVAGFRRSDQVADRTDSADARHQCRHLREWPPFADLLEAAYLGYMKVRVADFSMFILDQRDLRVAFDASNWFDGEFWHINPSC